jgi:hypothetical protein
MTLNKFEGCFFVVDLYISMPFLSDIIDNFYILVKLIVIRVI